jgi:hypothetical protein
MTSQPAAAAGQRQGGGGQQAPVLLTDAQMATFITEGFVVLPLRLEESWRASLLAKIDSLHHSCAAGHLERAEMWGQLNGDINAVVGGAVLQGALRSVLGDDFLMPPNGTLHASQAVRQDGLPLEQEYHKDGVDHGCTQNTVRDHCPRHVLAFIYLAETTIEMGPTAVLPRSHFLGIDREGFFHSEDRLLPEYQPPPAPRSRASRSVWLQKHAAARARTLYPDLTIRDALRLAGARELLGDAGIHEHFLTVPAGSAVLCHHDLFHRAARRRAVSAAWRPMLKVAAARVSEPVPGRPTWGHDPRSSEPAVAFQHVRCTQPAHRTLWAAVWEWLHGRRPTGLPAAVVPPPLPAVAALAQQQREAAGEMDRLAAGYQLGYRAAAGDASALRALADAATSSRSEREQRACLYGLTVAGEAAAAVLGGLVREAAPPIATAAAHALAQSCAGPSTRAAAAVTLVSRIERTLADLRAYEGITRDKARASLAAAAAADDADELPLPDFVATDGRRMLAQAATALGVLGHYALREEAAAAGGSIGGDQDEAAELVMVVARALLLLLVNGEPAGDCVSFMAEPAVQWNAAGALIKLCSTPDATPIAAALPRRRGPNQVEAAPNENVLAGMVTEARRRVCGPPFSPARSALTKLLNDTEWPFDTATQIFYPGGR